ncbi:MAG: nicotinate-nucleotide adenylyltransferase [Bacteroidetes bacterium]|nr:nicotinate-nucleotide adenylyltransferase [Bacteroidota bacterium]
MHIGLFFGSFNPVHVGHTVLANYMLSFTDMEQVWLVLSPQNPLKQKQQLLNQHNRLLLVNLAIDEHPNMRSSNIEFSLPQPSYTIHTLTHLKEKYPQHQFSLIMGQDNLQTFSKWKNYEEILKHCHVYVYPRPNGTPTEFDNHPKVHITDAPMMDISSTFIRKAIKEKKDIRFFLPHKVWEEIEASGFYAS